MRLLQNRSGNDLRVRLNRPSSCETELSSLWFGCARFDFLARAGERYGPPGGVSRRTDKLCHLRLPLFGLRKRFTRRFFAPSESDPPAVSVGGGKVRMPARAGYHDWKREKISCISLRCAPSGGGRNSSRAQHICSLAAQ